MKVASTADIKALIPTMDTQAATRFAGWCAAYTNCALRRLPLHCVVPKTAWPVYDSVWRFAAKAGTGADRGKKVVNYHALKAFQSCEVFCDRVGWTRLYLDAINHLINQEFDR